MEKDEVLFISAIGVVGIAFSIIAFFVKSLVAKWIWGILAVLTLGFAIILVVDTVVHLKRSRNKRKKGDDQFLDATLEVLRIINSSKSTYPAAQRDDNDASEEEDLAETLESDTVEEKPKRNVNKQKQHVVLHSVRYPMKKGVPADYFFCGDEQNPCAQLPLLAPLKIDPEKAVQSGIPGKNKWEGSKCEIIAENQDYVFYNYGCYFDGSGGCNLRQSKTNPKEVVFFGKARMFSCIYHDYLVQVNKNGYGVDLFLFVKEINSGKETIYPWFGKYSIPSGRGSRYDQDRIKNIEIDTESDTLLIYVQREFCVNADEDDEEYICNADTEYILRVSYDHGLSAVAEFPELNVTQVFHEQEYDSSILEKSSEPIVESGVFNQSIGADSEQDEISKNEKDPFEALFCKHYKSMLSITDRSPLVSNAKFELLPALYVISDYSAASCDKDRKLIAEALISKSKSLCQEFDKEVFDKRCGLYGEIIRGKKLRCEWYFGNTAPFDKNAITKSTALLGDILINPDCADDYDNAPIILSDFFEVMSFVENVMKPLLEEFTSLFNEIYDL